MALILSILIVSLALAFFAAPLWAWFVALFKQFNYNLIYYDLM